MWKASHVDKYIHTFVLETSYWHLLTQVIRDKPPSAILLRSNEPYDSTAPW